MTVDNIIASLSNLSQTELQKLNRAVVGQVKAARNRDAALKRRTLAVGQKVSWQGQLGETKGVITRIKRKKALCNVGGQIWDVPLNMLKAI